MKATIALAVLTVLGFAIAGCGGTKAISGSPLHSSTHAARGQSSHTTVPEDVIFWNAEDGLLEGGTCGAGGHTCTASGVELTTDGGHRYHLIRRTRDRKDTLDTVGSRGAAVISPQIGAQTALLTLNRGRTWKKVRWNWQVTWATPRIGLRSTFGGSDALELSSTHDGGRTWQRLPNPCHMLGPIPSASLPSAGRWWLFCAGQPQPGGPPNGARALFSTMDGGRHWKPVASTQNGTLPASAGGPLFAPDGFGLLYGYPRAFVTRNGGKTFSELPAGLTPVAAFNGGVAYALKRGHPLPVTLLDTRDSGRTWHIVRRWRG